MNLPEVGAAGQQRLKQSKVLVVGAGGLGCPALMSLSGAGVGTIGICEHDKVELSNLHRQFLYAFDDIGRSKLEVAREKIAARNPSVTVNEHHKKLNADNAEEIIGDYDIVLDCTDSITAKYVLNDACFLLRKTLIQVGIYQWEGQLRVMVAGQKGCLRCLWPQVPEPGCVGTCVDGGVLGVIPNVFGHLQAMEALRIILQMQSVFDNELLMFNIADFQLRRLKIKPDVQCPLCGSTPSIDALDLRQYQPPADYIVDVGSLTSDEFRKYVLVDVREHQERVMDPLEGFASEHMPLSEFTEEAIAFEKDRPYLLFCSAGIRSSRLAVMMHEMGYPCVFSVKDGIGAIRDLAHKPAP
jgi:adenylyltransferase/sulfurtransferase